MAVDLTIQTVTSGYNLDLLNSNFAAIEAALGDAVSRSGGIPNNMTSDLDMDSNNIINVGTVYAEDVVVDGNTIVGSAFADAAEAAADEAAASAAAALASAESAQIDADIAADTMLVWRGAWVTTTVYAVNDLAQQSGNTYICLVAHTSGTFATDLSNLKWDLFAQKGTNGAGTGDVLGSNNGSDFTNAATFRANLGIQGLDANLTSISALGTAADKMLYSTGVDTWAELSSPSFGRSLVSAASASAARTLLGTGTAAIVNTGVVSGTVPLIGVGDKLTESILPTAFGWEFVENSYANSTDGDVASAQTSTLSGDYEYMVRISSFGHDSGTSRELRIDLRGETLAAYTTGSAAITGSVSSSTRAFGHILFPDLRRNMQVHQLCSDMVTGSIPAADTGGTLTNTTVYRPIWNFTASQKVNRIRFQYSAGNINSGSITLYRRRIIS